MVIGSVQEMINKVSSNLFGDSEKEAKSKIHVLKSFASGKENTSLSLYVTVAEIACLFGCKAETYYKNFGFKVDDIMDLPYDRIWASVDLTRWYISLPWSKLVRMDKPVEKVLEHAPKETAKEGRKQEPEDGLDWWKQRVWKQYPDEYSLEAGSYRMSDAESLSTGHKVEYHIDLHTTDRDVYLDILDYASRRVSEAQEKENLLP